MKKCAKRYCMCDLNKYKQPPDMCPFLSLSSRQILPPIMLSDSDSETNDLHTLTINDHFAKAFEYKKEREELAKRALKLFHQVSHADPIDMHFFRHVVKEKYGSDYSESGSSDADDSEDSEDTEEDSGGEELTPAVDAAILRTLARIKKKDPAIYEEGRQLFEGVF